MAALQQLRVDVHVVRNLTPALDLLLLRVSVSVLALSLCEQLLYSAAADARKAVMRFLE
jgi:hypothetical protein